MCRVIPLLPENPALAGPLHSSRPPHNVAPQLRDSLIFSHSFSIRIRNGRDIDVNPSFMCEIIACSNSDRSV